jgi:hypothetical protein
MLRISIYCVTPAVLVLGCANLLAVDKSNPSGPDKSYDVVVVGAGTGGVAAAIQAGRQGVKVALLEETDWIGGQMTAAAVSTIDESNKLGGPQGFYEEFRERIGAYYASHGKTVGTCYYQNTSHCYEPSVAQKILYQMIEDVNKGPNGHVLDVYLRHRVDKVLVSDKTVTGVVTQDGVSFRAKVIIDATEYGDVLPLTPAAYRAGNNLSTRPFHSSCVQFITYVAVIKKYPNGVPPGLIMRDPPPGYDDAFVQRMRQVLVSDGNSATRSVPVSLTGLIAYRAVPDSSNPNNYSASTPFEITKTSLDWFNDSPATTDIFDRQKRQAIVCAAKLKTLRLLYYIQHEMKESGWSVANDEGYDTPYNREENSCSNIPSEFKEIEHNFPVLPYIRESQRLVGVYTLTSSAMRREGDPAFAVKQFESAIALGDYANDLHGCGQEADMESDLEHAGDLAGPRAPSNGPFQVPEEALIPLDVDGFLVAEKNLSQSRLASGATRLQPITMETGQAAGELAALAVKENLQPREIPIQDVQKALLRSNSSLTLENLADTPARTDRWRAAEFTVVHHWLLPKSPTAFGFGDIVTRGELAQALSNIFLLSAGPERWISAFGHSAVLTPDEVSAESATTQDIFNRMDAWKRERALDPVFNDVPPYSRFAAAIGDVARLGAMTGFAGQQNYFSPGSPATEAELVQGIRILVGDNNSSGSKDDEDVLNKWNRPLPLLKGNAAEIMYWFGTQQKSWPVKWENRLDLSPNSVQVIQ